MPERLMIHGVYVTLSIIDEGAPPPKKNNNQKSSYTIEDRFIPNTSR